MRLLLGALTLLTIGGCKTSNYASGVRVANGIDSGAGEFPAVTVLHTAETLDSAYVGDCTATWVAPETLLTAAHCVISKSGKKTERAWVTDPITSRKIVAAENNVVFHSRYLESSSIEGNFDIALIKFDEPVSRNLLSVASVTADIDDEALIVGYGITSKGGGDAGTKRFGTNRIRRIDSKADSTGTRSAKDAIVLHDGYVSTSAAQSQEAERGTRVANLQGDSGGPLLVGGRVLGVASTVDDLAADRLVGQYISTFFHREWLRSSGFRICGLTMDCPNTPQSNAEARSPRAMTDGDGGSLPPVAPLSPEGDEPKDTPPTGTPESLVNDGGEEAPNAAPPIGAEDNQGQPQGQPHILTEGGKPRGVQLDCNRDYHTIRGGGSGVCLNRSSGNCYRFGNGDINYDAGAVTCGGGNSAPPVNNGGTAGVLLDCNRDYSQIRAGGTGVCRNNSSGNCYRFGGGDVKYQMGPVRCGS